MERDERRSIPEQETGEPKQEGLKRLAQDLIQKLTDNLNHADARKMEQAGYRPKYLTDYSIYDLSEIAEKLFALERLKDLGLVSEAEIAPLSQRLVDFMKYEVERREEVAKPRINTGTHYLESETRRHMIETENDAILTRNLLAHLESESK